MPVWATKKYRQERAKRVAEILRKQIKGKVVNIKIKKGLELADKVAKGEIYK